MADANTPYIIRGVEAVYPRLNSPYRFDQTAGTRGKSVPCDPLDEGAKYEVQFRMSAEQAKTLFKSMMEAYVAKREQNWPEKITMPFTKEADGTFTGKAALKGAYGKQVTNKPKQYDAKNKELAEDFQLTTGSTVNIQVVFVPYSMRDTGVSLRLRAVQVIKYKPREAYSPFDVEDGFTVEDDTEVTGFELAADEPEEIAEPVKAERKKAKPKPKEEAELDDILAEFDD